MWAALDADLVAVRSSWALEDGHQRSFAGLLETSLGVRPSGLQDAIEACWDRAFKTHGHLLGPRDTRQPTPSMALIVQRMVEATVAGVAFSANPLTGATDEVHVNATWGLGIAVASDLVDPDVYILDRDGSILREEHASKNEQYCVDPSGSGVITCAVPAAQREVGCMSPRALRELGTCVSAVAEAFGHPVDVEWAIDGQGLHLLQARPITAYGRRMTAL